MEKESSRILCRLRMAQIKFTIAKYYTPNGTDIHKKGIKPDVKVKMSDAQWKKAQTDEKADKQLKKAIELLEK